MTSAEFRDRVGANLRDALETAGVNAAALGRKLEPSDAIVAARRLRKVMRGEVKLNEQDACAVAAELGLDPGVFYSVRG